MLDIVAFSGTRVFERGQWEEMGSGHVFFWVGRPRAVRRDADVAFAIRNGIVKRLLYLLQASATDWRGRGFWSSRPNTSETSSTVPPPPTMPPTTGCPKWKSTTTWISRLPSQKSSAQSSNCLGKAPGSVAIPDEIFKQAAND
ncbi:hypothetical protein SprV_0702411400 [Sparganum proliferum]